MALEDVLGQHAEIIDFLKSLVAVHKRALQEQNLSLQLDGIRRDIYICFNDLCKLNEMLIAYDGEIKETIDMLKTSKDKFGRLAKKEEKLLEDREGWAFEISQVPRTRESLSIESGYRPFLNSYIELVGATNTPLADERTEEEIDRERLIRSMNLLRACDDEATRDIKQLESLLRDFKKDRAFIAKELRTHQARIRRETNSIDEALERVHQSKKKLLSKVGLAVPEAQESFLAQKFFNLQMSEEQKKKMQEQEDIANHAGEFIDMKICSLQDQLTHKKEDSSSLVSQRNLWGECMQMIGDLERRLGTALSSEHNLPAVQVKGWLKSTIDDLNAAIAVTDSEVLTTLITGEKEVIEKAFGELSSDASRPLNIPKRNRYATSPSHNHSSPPFLVASKSPPKIGVTEETVDPATGGNLIELEEMDFPREKHNKRD